MLFTYSLFFFFFFNDTATTEIYPLPLHDALPISNTPQARQELQQSLANALNLANAAILTAARETPGCRGMGTTIDRKSTRLNSSHTVISYAVFCLKKKKKYKIDDKYTANSIYQTQ